jgi:ABC-type polysaccharide/polyol phosphate export permease
MGTSRENSLEWEHRTSRGIEYGAEVPTGRPVASIEAFRRALRQAWQTRRIVWLLAVNDYKSGFRAQSLGMFWAIANPLVMMVTLTVAFTQILRINIPSFPIFYLSGALFWHYFTGTLSSSSQAFLSRSSLVLRTTFPRFMVPAISLVRELFTFGIEFALLFGLYFVFPEGFRFTLALLFLPVIFAILFVFCLGAGLLVASLQVRYRDVQYVVQAITIVGFWTTPILYGTAMAPPWIAPWLRLNPLAGIVEGARSCVLEGRVPELITLVPSVFGAVVLLLLAAHVYRRENLTMADYL